MLRSRRRRGTGTRTCRTTGWCGPSRRPAGARVATLTEYGVLAKIGVNDSGLGVMLNMLHHDADAQRVGRGAHRLPRARAAAHAPGGLRLGGRGPGPRRLAVVLGVVGGDGRRSRRGRRIARDVPRGRGRGEARGRPARAHQPLRLGRGRARLPGRGERRQLVGAPRPSRRHPDGDSAGVRRRRAGRDDPPRPGGPDLPARLRSRRSRSRRHRDPGHRHPGRRAG